MVLSPEIRKLIGWLCKREYLHHFIELIDHRAAASLSSSLLPPPRAFSCGSLHTHFLRVFSRVCPPPCAPPRPTSAICASPLPPTTHCPLARLIPLLLYAHRLRVPLFCGRFLSFMYSSPLRLSLLPLLPDSRPHLQISSSPSVAHSYDSSGEQLKTLANQGNGESTTKDCKNVCKWRYGHAVWCVSIQYLPNHSIIDCACFCSILHRRHESSELGAAATMPVDSLSKFQNAAVDVKIKIEPG